MLSLINFAYEFLVISVYSLLFSASIVGLSWLLCHFYPWIRQWRSYWIIALSSALACLPIGLIPIQDIWVLPMQLPELSIEALNYNLLQPSLAVNSVPEIQIQWKDALALTWLSLYGFGVLIGLIKISVHWRNINQLIRQACQLSELSEATTSARYAKLQRLAGIYSLSIRITKQTISPFIVQWPKSYLIISEFALTEMSNEEFDLMLRHELQHLKRGDGRLNLLIQMSLCLLWFNPFIKQLAQQLRWAVELSCDNSVLSRRPNLRRIYAQAMLKILRGSTTGDANQTVAAFSSKQHRSITMRIKHIMNPSGYRINTSAKNAVLLGLGMSMSALLLAFHPMSHARQDNQNLKMVHPVPQAKLTSSYGVENKMHKFHNGVDLAAQIDTPVMAAAAGKVVTATENLKGFKNYGTIIVIDHGNGLQTLYSHLNTLNVTEGEWVQSGQLIGGVGETGRATGPHVHFEVIKNGERVDPKNYVVIDS